MFKVAVVDPQFIGVQSDISIGLFYVYLTKEKKVLEDIASTECFEATNVEEIPERIGDVDALLAWHHIPHIGRDVLEKMKKAKVIVRIGMGFDNIDIEAAGNLGIIVSNVPDYGVEEVADSALCMILNVMRKTYWTAKGTQAGEWSVEKLKGASRLRGKTLGLVGVGRIGTAVALRAKAFNLNVQFFDPWIEHGKNKALGITQVDSLEILLQTSDIVSLHCPLIHKTMNNTHMLNETTFQYFKKGSILINTARGGLIQESALVNALKDGTIKAAALDVFEHEPYQGPLLEFPDQVMLTPHGAFYSEEGLIEMRTKAAEEVRRVLEGKNPRYCVNAEHLRKNK